MSLGFSRKSPLWVAAFFFKHLTKAQVIDTDISSTVDKILKDEITKIDAVSYRMLANLLLGVVRIYSKKVEYLFIDCDDVLIKINKFEINTKENADVKKLRMSIRIPDRFELDTFDLDELEDTLGGHMASNEEITLKDVLCTNEKFGVFSLERFEEFDFGETSRSVNHLMLEDVHESHLMDIDIEVLQMNSPINTLPDKDMDIEVLRRNSPINSLPNKDMDMDFDTGVGVDGVGEESQSMLFETSNECVDHDDSSLSNDKCQVLIEESAEDHQFNGKFEENVPIQDGKLSVIPPQSKNFDVTPHSMSHGGSVGRPKSGGSPDFMLISTPAGADSALMSRKRKAIVDQMIILPTKVLKKNIQDSSDLVSGRRESRNILTMQRQFCISSLLGGFYESSHPCYSSKIQSLYSKNKMRILVSLEVVETSGNLNVLELQTVARPEHTAAAPVTPPQCSIMKGRSTEHQERTGIQNSEFNVGTSNSNESVEREQFLTEDDDRNLMNEFNVGTSNSNENIEREQFLREDEDLNLMNVDINSCETENSDLTGWSERTRNVARSLRRKFQDRRNEEENEVVNFSQVLGGRARKECARLFYEVLVLKTSSCVDVKQKHPYGDIAIEKLPKLDEAFVTDDGLSLVM